MSPEPDWARLARQTIRTTKTAPPTSATTTPIDAPTSTSPNQSYNVLRLTQLPARALSIMSKKMFGTSVGPVEGSPAGQHHQILLGTLEYTVVAFQLAKPVATPARFVRVAGESAKDDDTRRKHEEEAETAAVTAIGLQMAVMNFATGALVIARRFLDGRKVWRLTLGLTVHKNGSEMRFTLRLSV
ncbi:unnamed protein product [Rhizoctonia solani]|uniref:Uncharacterized protein n=1 Tax=Rhizoctonia solani TaxID=456999 RepID=A0A8H3HVL8_9AGAM|nr:unnamed protein product [Rhizoctonia solani]